MADSYLRRILQFVFDRGSARRTEAEAKASLGRVEKSAGRLEAFFKRLGGVLAAAFGVRALINFGREAIRQAAEAEAVWASLQNTIENTGESFEELEADLRSLSSAFQEATVHTDEDYAQSLDRLIALTGDVSASVQNMGLVANVAAKFFKGELAPATDLVAKAMNGQTMALRRMGIQAESAQDALNILAERSLGAAEARAATFGGRLQQITNLWDEWKEQLGNAMVANDQAVGALDVLKGVLIQLIHWTEENQDALRSWITNGLKVTITVLDALYRTLRSLVDFMAAPLVMAVASATLAFGILAKGFALGATAAVKFLDVIGLDGIAGRLDQFTDALNASADSLIAWGAAKEKAGLDLLAQGFKRFATPTFDLNIPPARRGRAPGAASLFDVGGPLAGKNALATEETEDAEKALEEYAKAMRGIILLSRVLGKDYDALGAEIDALTTLVKKLAAAGWEASNPAMQGYLERLRAITSQAAEQKALRALEDQLQTIRNIAPALGQDFDALAAEAAALEQAIESLGEAGFGATDPRMQEWAARLREIKRELAEQNAFRTYEEGLLRQQELLRALGQQYDDFGQAIDPVTTAMQSLQAEADLLKQTIADLIDQGFDAGDPILAGYIERLHELEKAMARNKSMMAQVSAAAEIFGQAVGAAFAGGIGPFAAGKARENLIEAAEHTARGIGALLNPFTAGLAAGHFALAAKHTAIAGAWKALSSAFGGSGGASGGGGGGGTAGSRGASAGAAAQAQPAQTEVHLHMDGHLSAMDIELQAATRGALQEIGERQGNNVVVRTHRDGKAQTRSTMAGSR